MQAEQNAYSTKNESVRFETFDRLDEKNGTMFYSFFRRIGLERVYWELIAPTLKGGNTLVCAAIADRPWPPWGIGAQKVVALVHVHPIGETDAGLSPVFVADENLGNVGLMSATYKETLEHLSRIDKGDLTYVVWDHSVFARRVLSSLGFEKTGERYLTEHAGYHLYRANATHVLRRLGLADVMTPDLLTHNIEDSVFDRNALFHSMTQLGSRGFWWETSLIAEIIANLGIGIGASLPGGVGGTPGPTKGPEGPGEPGGGVEVGG